MKVLVLLAALGASLPVWAQSASTEEPALKTSSTPTAQPVMSNKDGAPPAAKPAEKAVEADDSPIGLFIMPWRNASAQKDIDRPARLLEGEMSPIDQVVFDRQVEYHDVLEAHVGKPASGAAKP